MVNLICSLFILFYLAQANDELAGVDGENKDDASNEDYNPEQSNNEDSEDKENDDSNNDNALQFRLYNLVRGIAENLLV